MTIDEFSVLMTASGIELPTGEQLVVWRSDLGMLIDLAEARRLVVLGLDGARAEVSSVVPLIEYIADSSEITGSWESRVRQSAEAARRINRLWGSEAELAELILDGLRE